MDFCQYSLDDLLSAITKFIFPKVICMKVINRSRFFVLILLLILLSCSKDEVKKEDSGLPMVTINTNGQTIVNTPKINANYVVTSSGATVNSGIIGIEYRGSTSYRLFPKKSYAIETRDATGANLTTSLLGFPEENDWALIAPYDDKTLMRNVISYELSNQIGMYAPRTKFVEVTVNDEYLGVYVLTEKIKHDKNRVAVSKLTGTDTDPAIISGGYILKIDKTAGDNTIDDWSADAIYTQDICFRSGYDQFGASLTTAPYQKKTSAETYFLYTYPKSEDINDSEKNYIQLYMHDFETALANEDFSTSTRAYEDYIDVDSFVDYFILCEFTHNADAYRLSTFMNKDRNGKLKMGPIWDMNLSYGEDGDSYRNSPSTWIYQYNTYIPNDLWLVPFWWTKLLQDPLFKSKVKSRWTALRANTLLKTNIYSVIDAQVTILKNSGAKDRNFQKWPILGVQVPFNGYVGQTYDDEVNFMKNWIDQRLTWLDEQINLF